MLRDKEWALGVTLARGGRRGSNEFNLKSGKGRNQECERVRVACAFASRDRKCTYRATARRASRRARESWMTKRKAFSNERNPQPTVVAYSWNDFNVLIFGASSSNYLSHSIMVKATTFLIPIHLLFNGLSIRQTVSIWNFAKSNSCLQFLSRCWLWGKSFRIALA